MTITLGNRSEESVRTFFRNTQTEEIKRLLPLKAKTEDEAVEDYRASLLPGARSHGKTILADGVHVGDIWCIFGCRNDIPTAEFNFCVFNKEYRSKGVATEALRQFMDDIIARYESLFILLYGLGGYTYSENEASCRVFEKCGFEMFEEYVDEGRFTKYFQIMIDHTDE